MIRARLLAPLFAGEANDAYFDALALRSLRAPVLAIDDVAVTEGDAGTTDAIFTVSLSCGYGHAVDVSYQTADGTAVAGDDYLVSTGGLSFPVGAMAQTIAVPVVGDGIDKPQESFLVELFDLSSVGDVVLPAGTAGIGTIVDDDEAPELLVSSVTVDETESEAIFTVELSAATGFDVTVGYATADGTATTVDYESAAGELSFPAGTTSRTVAVGIVDDSLDEDTDTFLLTLTNAVHAVLPAGPGVGTIVDDDPPPSVSIADVTVNEGDAGTVSAVFTMTMSSASGREIAIGYQTTGGTAAVDQDYLAASGNVTFAAGTTTQTVAVAVRGDVLDEPDETFRVVLVSPVNVVVSDGEGIGTIIDNDEPPTIDVDDVTIVEGDSGTTDAVFTLTLTAVSGYDVTVDYMTADGTAQSESDYVATSGTVTLPAGTLTGTVTVEVVGDLIDELDETFGVELTNPQHVVVGDGLGVGTIGDDDEALITLDDVAVAEGDTETSDAIFTVALATPSDREIRVDYATVAATATADEDYLTTSDNLVFAVGVTEQTLAVPILGDVILERDETFRIELSNPVNTTIEDAEGLGTILDDELCVGPNLLINPGSEARPVDGEIPGWTMVSGSDWQRRFAPPEPVEGVAYFFAGTAGLAELVQDVDVSAYATRIAAGDQHFAFDGHVRTFDEVPPDVASIVVEYRDASNSIALDTFDSGEIASPYGWHQISDVRAAPAGTGWIRVRLIATRFTEGDNDGYFDALSLRSLRAPTVAIDDVVAYEGHSGTTQAVFTVDLACAYGYAVSVDYLTYDVTALAGEDYLETSGGLAFPVGVTTQTVPVPILADAENEPDETFLVELSNLSAAGDPVLLDPLGIGTIRNDDFCPRSHGYWKNHTEEWPVDWLVLGGVEYDAVELMAFLEYKGKDASSKLALQLVATKLNLVSGSDPWILPVVEAADAFLEIYPPGSNPGGEARQEGNAIKDDLDAYNNSCPND